MAAPVMPGRGTNIMANCWPLSAAFPSGQQFGANPRSSTNPDSVNPIGGHTGTDFPCPIGTPVRAPSDGVIEYARAFQTMNGSDNSYWLTAGGGNTIVLNAGAAAPSFVMAHLDRFAVVEGQRVKQGDIIGYSGNSGMWTTGPHLHFETLAPGFNLNSGTYGRSNPANFCTFYWQGAATPLAANQRVSGPYIVKQRSAPRQDAPVVREIAPNSIEVFRGYVIGEEVVVGGKKSSYWLQDQYGYCSAILFDPEGVAGLDNLTPKPASDPVGPNQRVTADGGAQGRNASNKNAAAVGERFDADLILTFKGYVHGETPYPGTTDVWFVGISGAYFWAGAFVDEGTHDLPDLTPKATPLPPSIPAPAAYGFKADILRVNGINIEVAPANITNVEVGNFPAKPVSAVDHHWGTPPVAISSVINEFQKSGTFKSAHYVVTVDRIVQMVSLKDRAYHAGPQGNVFVGVEIDPRGYEKDASGKYTATAVKIQENVRALHAALNDHFGYTLTQTLHKNVPGNNTQCSPFDLEVLKPTKVAPVPAPAPAPAPVPAPATPAPAQCVPDAPVPSKDSTRKELDDFMDWQIDQYLNQKK